MVSCFDREVNVRRAASAAYQEGVGRLGIFPHGIEVMTSADYFSVGLRTNAFLRVATKIARLDEYRPMLVQHLVDVSLTHWDKNIRSLAAESLRLITPVDQLHMVQKVLPQLLDRVLSTDLHTRHGALLATGAITLSAIQTDSASVLSSNDAKTLQRILGTAEALPSAYFKSFGSELICEATCSLISDLCIVISLFQDYDLDQRVRGYCTRWKEIVRESLSRKEEPIHIEAAKAVKSMASVDVEVFDLLPEINVYMNKLNPTGDKFERRGFALALGAIDWSRRDGRRSKFDAVLIALEGSILAFQNRSSMHDDAEARKNAAVALGSILNQPQSLRNVFTKDQISAIFTTFMLGLQDYSIDSRGDVGSFVREACIRGLRSLIESLILSDAKNEEKWTTPQMYDQIVGGLLKQSVERIDKLRGIAGDELDAVLNLGPFEPSGKEVFDEVFKGYVRRSLLTQLTSRDPVQWNTPNHLYPRIINLLVVKQYRKSLLTGLILSAGGVSESLVRSAGNTLLNYVNELPISDTSSPFSLLEFANELVELLKENNKNDRTVLPLFQVLDQLFEGQILQKAEKKWS